MRIIVILALNVLLSCSETKSYCHGFSFNMSDCYTEEQWDKMINNSEVAVSCLEMNKDQFDGDINKTYNYCSIREFEPIDWW